MEIILHRQNEGGTFENEFLILTIQKSYTVGRKLDNDIVLNSKGIAKKHCIFHHNSDGLFIELLKGLQINGVEKIQGAIISLKNEDIVHIGETHTYKVEIEPLLPDVPVGNQSNSNSVKTEPIDTLLSESQNTTPQTIIIKSELQDPEFLEIQNVSVNPEELDSNLSENRIRNIAFQEENVNIPLPPIEIKRERDESLLNTTHSIEFIEPEQAFEQPIGIAIKPLENPDLAHQPMPIFSSPKISDFDGAMQISIEEHETKPSILPLINPESSTSTSQTLNLPVHPENQVIKQEPAPLDEVVSQDLVTESDLNQIILQNRIKVENPDIPFTNVSLFATAEQRISEQDSNPDFIPENSELLVREKTPEILLNQSFLPVNAKISSRPKTPDLEQGMQFDVEEPDIKPFPFLPINFVYESGVQNESGVHNESDLQNESDVQNESGVQNESETEKSDSNRPLLRIRSDLGMGIKVEPGLFQPPLENQFQSIESSIEPSILEQNDLGVMVKEERIEPLKTQIEESNLRIRIKEERPDPPESPEVEFMEEKRKRGRRDSDETLFGVRIKQEKIDPPESVQNELDLLDPSVAAVRIKREKPDPPIVEPSIQNQTPLGVEADIQPERIKPEPDFPDSPDETFREDPAQERESSDPIDYSQLVQDEIDIHEEKPGPSLMERLSQFEMYSESLIRKRIKEEAVESLPSAKRIKRGSSSSDSASSDSSDSDEDSSQSLNSRDKKGYDKSVAVKEEDEGVNRSLTPAEREEYNRYLMISEIIDSNNDPEEVDKLIRELDRKLEKENARKKRNEVHEVNDDEVEIIREDRSRKHKKKGGKRDSKRNKRSDKKKERSHGSEKKKKRKGKEREINSERRQSLRRRGSEVSFNKNNGDLRESEGRETPRRRESPQRESPQRESPQRKSPRRREFSKRGSSLRESLTRETEATPFGRSDSPNSDDFPRNFRRENKFPVDPSPRSPEASESSKDSSQAQENENKDSRSDPMDRNYPGARVLDDYELLEERGRSDPRDPSKYGTRPEKKKLDYKEYLKRRAMAKSSSGGEGSRGRGAGPRKNENSGIVPISSFGDPYSQPKPQPLMNAGFRVPNPGGSISTFRTQPQSLGYGPPVDSMFMQRGVEHAGVPAPLMDPRAQGRPQSSPFGIPGAPPAFDPRYQGRPDLHSPIEGSRDPRYMYGGLENPGVPFDPRYQGRDMYSSMEGPRDSRFMYGGMETPGIPSSTFDPRLSGRVETGGEGSRDHRSRTRGIQADEVKITAMKRQRSGARVMEPPPSTSGKELVMNPISKLKIKNGKDEKKGKSEDRLTQKVSQLKVVHEIKLVIRSKPVESKDLSDELLVTIFSWHPQIFESGLIRNTPIISLRNVGQTSLAYENYEAYCATAFPLLLLDVSLQIQEAFSSGLERPLLQDCHILPSTIPKVKVPARKAFLVPLLLKSSVSILDDTKPPSEGDLLRFSLVSDYKKSALIFGYIQKVVNEESTDIPRKVFTYLVSVSEQDFDIHKSAILAIQPIVNLKHSIEKAKALFFLKRSALLPCILRPNPQILNAVPAKPLSQDDLISRDPLDKMQLTAVSKVLRAFESELPHICLVEGSPGTGKTNIIVNTILQLLCAQKHKIDKERLRILVSASTNVEMEEIILKLKSVIEFANIEKDVVKMVLVGPDEGRRERTKELNLSNFARNHVESDIHRYQETMGLKSMEEQATFLTEQMTILTKKFEMTKCVHVALQMSLIKMYYDIGRSGRKVKKMTAQEKKELLEVAEKTFLAGANLIFCSIPNLGCAVMENLSEKHAVGVCIVDESAQILELDTIKVLPFKQKTLVLLGDVCKNPTNYDNSPRLRGTGFGCSLFSRIENNFGPNENSPVTRLLTQYRMSPPIEDWLTKARIFGMNSIRNLVRQNIQFPLHPLRIFNLGYTEDFVDNEAVFASRLIHCIVSFGDLRRMERNISVGVIISDIDAKDRVEQDIKNRMEEIVPGKAQIFNIEVDIIDGFLNHEKDIILASCIRNRHLTSRAGFQRFYCGLTRAKHCLIIYGRFFKISKYKQPCEWHQLVDYARNVVSVSAYAESTELRRDLIR